MINFQLCFFLFNFSLVLIFYLELEMYIYANISVPESGIDGIEFSLVKTKKRDLLVVETEGGFDFER